MLQETNTKKMSVSVTDNINSFNNVLIHNTIADNQSEILKWLSPLEPRIRHQDVRTRRVDNIGERLLHTSGFRKWCDGAQYKGSDYEILFCYGGPGVGKTYFR